MSMHLLQRGLLAALLLAGIGRLSAAQESRIYIEFKPGQKAVARGLVQQAGGRTHHEFDGLNAVAVTVPDAALAGIRNNPNVVLVEEDPARYLFGCSLPLENYPYGLDAVQATDLWDSAPSDGQADAGAPTGSGIKVGIIDSGVFPGHSDLAPLGSRLTGYPTGYPTTDERAWNRDRNGHGTHVTGTIAAALNGSGVAGVSPGVSVHMVKVFGSDGGWVYSSTLLNAAQQCQAVGCKIISMSLGGGRPSRTEENGFNTLYNAGILLVAAAGNAGNTTTSYPAGYATVMSVAAVDEANAVASFSQQNADVEVAAPGVGVLSTVPYCDENTVVVGASTVAGNPVEFAARGTAVGALVDGGRALATNPAWAGKVVLVERGDVSFLDKVRNVQNSGGVACVIYNNVAGEALFATLGAGNSSTIPAIGLTQQDGQALLALAGSSATVTSTIEFETSDWAEYDGTSMATPHVSAVAALLWSAAPAKSNAQIRTALTSTAKDLGPAGRDNAFGFGLVQAKAALESLVPSGGGDTTPPVISNVASSKVNTKKGTFEIRWTTSEPATSKIFLGGTLAYSSTTLTTSHARTFQGTKGATYSYTVESADAAGNVSTAGPFTHQN